MSARWLPHCLQTHVLSEPAVAPSLPFLCSLALRVVLHPGVPSVLRPSASAAAALWVCAWLATSAALVAAAFVCLLTRLSAATSLLLCCAGNTIRTNLISTGAFEVSYEGVPIWSKVGAAARRGCCARGLIVGCSGSSAECHAWLSTLLQPMASGALLALQQHAVPQCLLSRRCSLVFRVCSWRRTACPRCSTSSTASRRHECNAAWLLFCLYFVTRLPSHTPCAGPMPGVVLAAWCHQGFTWQCHQLASFTCRP